MESKDILYFAGRPLVRCGDKLIYGNIIDRYYCRIFLPGSDSDGNGKVTVRTIDNVARHKEDRYCKDLPTAVFYAKNWIDAQETMTS